MGALSKYYNYNSNPYQPLQTNTNSEINTFQHHEQEQQLLLPELTQILEHNHHFSSSYLDETLFFQSPYFYSNETYPSHEQLLFDSTFSSQNDGFISMNEIFPNEENFNTYLPCAKRQKLCYEEKKVQQQEEILNSTNFFVDEFMTNPFGSFEAEQPFCSASKIVGCEKKVYEKTISSQSIVARERRRKITEKTQELGKLVPGGPKMNTAEMLIGAANYVKFLQAQVGMLQVMGTLSKEEKEPPPSQDIHKLLVSPFVQEKLYLEEKCFVTKEFITTLTNHDNVRSKPTILKGLKQLIGTEINEKKPKQE
ncbi:transcription factor bHLH53-like [Trifolium pratense]|uniref:transcription factor bHLH53-like n=1 Tax=Trifolium pratense TaxID=57577 RepID=UPI001E692CEF|nr:transcription factor bHLH53-like [Trifolium pratense]